MQLPARGILYVADRNVVPELLLSVWTARKTNPDIPVSIVAIQLPEPVLHYLERMGVAVLAPKCRSWTQPFAVKKEAYIHRLYQKTLFVDADTVFVQKLDEALWDVAPGSLKVHARTHHYYTKRQFWKVHQSLARCGYPDQWSLTEENYCAFNSGVFVYPYDLQPVLEQFFIHVPEDTWNVALKKSLGADQGLLQYLCLSRHIPVHELDYAYNFEEHYHNHKKFYNQPVDKTLRHAFTAAIIWKRAFILHHHAYMWLHELPKHIVKQATLRTLIDMLEPLPLFAIDSLKQDVQTWLPHYAEMFKYPLPLLINLHDKIIPKMLYRITKKFL